MAIHAQNGLLEFITECHTLRYLLPGMTQRLRQTPTKLPRHYSLCKGCKQKKSVQYSLLLLTLVYFQL